MTLVDLADELAEVRRYVRSQPEYVRDRLNELFRYIYKTKGPYSLGMRVGDNIYVVLAGCYIFNDAGQFVAFTNVHVLEGYLDGAVYEIRQHAERQRKERGE